MNSNLPEDFSSETNGGSIDDPESLREQMERCEQRIRRAKETARHEARSDVEYRILLLDFLLADYVENENQCKRRADEASKKAALEVQSFGENPELSERETCLKNRVEKFDKESEWWLEQGRSWSIARGKVQELKTAMNAELEGGESRGQN